MAEGCDIPGLVPGVIVRLETYADYQAIAVLTTRAFAPMTYADGDEAQVIDRLRTNGALALSLVAEADGRVAGHVAFSPMTGDVGWYALGPVSVAPERQRQGFGSLLIRTGLGKLRDRQAKGCALVGDPTYYKQFGFEPKPSLAPKGQSSEYFQMQRFGEEWPSAPVDFDPAFYQ